MSNKFYQIVPKIIHLTTSFIYIYIYSFNHQSFVSFSHFILLNSAEKSLSRFLSLLSPIYIFFFLFFYNDFIAIILTFPQGNTVENGIFEKKRLVNSDRNESQASIIFGNIPRYTRGQYSLMKSRAA